MHEQAHFNLLDHAPGRASLPLPVLANLPRVLHGRWLCLPAHLGGGPVGGLGACSR